MELNVQIHIRTKTIGYCRNHRDDERELLIVSRLKSLYDIEPSYKVQIHF